MAERWNLERLSMFSKSDLRNLPMAFASTFTFKRVAACLPLLLPCIYFLLERRAAKNKQSLEEEEESTDDGTDPGLLKKHSSYDSYHVPDTGFTYPSIRTFFRPHPHGDKLPVKPTPVPLLVCVHGLGGSVVQFHPLLSSLVNIAPTLAIDLPGCGLSSFRPKAWKAYTTDALVHLLAVIIEKHRDVEADQGVILVCHSMGCSLATLLTSATSPYKGLIAEYVRAVVAICPAAEPPSAKKVSLFRKLLLIPGPIFDLWRRWDRRGGTESASIARFAGPNAEEKTKKLQLLFNEQSRTPVWRRMASGVLPDYSSDPPIGGIPGKYVWMGMKIPLFLIAGQADHVTPADNVRKIAGWLGRDDEVKGCNELKVEKDSVQENGVTKGLSNIHHPVTGDTPVQNLDASSTKPAVHEPESSSKSTKAGFEAIILPSPASHALLYDARTARSLSAHIQRFLAVNVDHRLNLGWQLQYLTREGKWDVKNLEKWRAVEPVSLPIANFFRALKTLREVDESHTPKVFVKEWAPEEGGGKDGLGSIVAIVDITHESPVYDYRSLEAGGIAYRKFPTVSKFPPTEEEVKLFIEVVDTLRSELLSDSKIGDEGVHRLIAVHCHYGFNRTGFFIIAYMVERLGWHLKEAIAEFGEKRPPGVRHAHFVDELYARYWTMDDYKS